MVTTWPTNSISSPGAGGTSVEDGSSVGLSANAISRAASVWGGTIRACTLTQSPAWGSPAIAVATVIPTVRPPTDHASGPIESTRPVNSISVSPLGSVLTSADWSWTDVPVHAARANPASTTNALGSQRVSFIPLPLLDLGMGLQRRSRRRHGEVTGSGRKEVPMDLCAVSQAVWGERRGGRRNGRGGAPSGTRKP